MRPWVWRLGRFPGVPVAVNIDSGLTNVSFVKVAFLGNVISITCVHYILHRIELLVCCFNIVCFLDGQPTTKWHVFFLNLSLNLSI